MNELQRGNINRRVQPKPTFAARGGCEQPIALIKANGVYACAYLFGHRTCHASSAMESYSFISADLAKTRKAHGSKGSCTSPRDSITAVVSHPLSPHRSSAELSVLCQRPGGIRSRSSVGS